MPRMDMGIDSTLNEKRLSFVILGWIDPVLIFLTGIFWKCSCKNFTEQLMRGDNTCA